MITSRSITLAVLLFLLILPAVASAQSNEPLIVTYSPSTIPEGSSEERVVNVTATLSRPAPRGFSIAFRPQRLPNFGIDYNNAAVSIQRNPRFEANQTQTTFPLRVRGTDAYESILKQFTFLQDIVFYDPPHTGPEVRGSVTFTLAEDDPIPTLSVSDVRVVEGNQGSKQILATVTASHTAFSSFEFRLVRGSATPCCAPPADPMGDYALAGIPFAFRLTNTRTFTIGEYPPNFAAPVYISIMGDTRIEPDETFEIELYNVTNANVGRRGVVTIVNDDFPSATLTQPTQRVPAGRSATFTIALSDPAVTSASIALASSNPAVVVPATVPVAAGATSVSFQAEVRRDVGMATITITLPASLGSKVLTATVDTFDRIDLQFTPRTASVYAGSTTPFALSAAPARNRPLAVALAMPAELEAERSVTIPEGGSATVAVTALVPGIFELAALPPTSEFRGATVRLEVLMPSVTAIAPTTSTTAGGTSVAISGVGFSPACTVSFGDTPATSVEFVDVATLKAVTPAHAAGAVAVNVTCGRVTIPAPQPLVYGATRRRPGR